MDLKDIKQVIDLMTKNALTEFELEKGDFKLRVKRGPGGEWITAAAPAVPALPIPAYLPVPTAVPTLPSPVASAPATASVSAGAIQIPSPMVGTFYSSPTPDSAPFVEIGQVVTEDTVVCIIEAMKVMNEIKAETKGVIVEVLAQNGKPVEFNKPLFSVRPS